MTSGNTSQATPQTPETTFENTTRSNPETLALINSELADRLARQSDSGARVDTKSVFLLGLVAAATQFLATRQPQPVLASLAFAAYGVAFVSGVVSLAVVKYEDLKPEGMFEMAYPQLPKEHLLEDLVAARGKIFKANREKHKRKARFWEIALAALSVGLVLSAAAMVETGHRDEPGTGSRQPANPRPTASHT